MVLRLSLVMAAAVLLAPGSAAAQEDANVVVETNRQLYEPGEVVQATITNNRAAALFVGGCGAIVVERLEDEVYRSVAGEPCVTEGRAVRIEPGKTLVLDIKEAGRSGEVRRLSLAFGWGCNDARALSQARCTDFATAVSPPYRVGRREDPKGE